MKIAVVTRYFPNSAEPWQGRSAYQIMRLIARKADVQADVRVFFPNSNYPSWLKPPSRTYDALDTSYSPPDVNMTYHNYPAAPLLSRPINGWLASRALLPDVRKFAPDIIHSFFLYPEGYAALKIGRALGVPVVAKSLGSDINRLGKCLTFVHTRRLVRDVDFLFTVSNDLRTKAISMGAKPEKTQALINGCDLSVFHAMDRLEARKKLNLDPALETVVYIGRMDVNKGLRELVEAAASLHPRRPNLCVYMIGAGPDRPTIESAIRDNDAAGYIHVLPACSFDEVAVWMTAADLVTLPSYMEGCPNVVLEALACGRPVVATKVGGIPEIMPNECGQLVPPRDPAALAQALASVLDRTWDPKVISALGSRSWDDVAGELFSHFESLVYARNRVTPTR
jgi:glycosyltransferase involved in cell wall biosynthesis